MPAKSSAEVVLPTRSGLGGTKTGVAARVGVRAELTRRGIIRAIAERASRNARSPQRQGVDEIHSQSEWASPVRERLLSPIRWFPYGVIDHLHESEVDRRASVRAGLPAPPVPLTRGISKPPALHRSRTGASSRLLTASAACPVARKERGSGPSVRGRRACDRARRRAAPDQGFRNIRLRFRSWNAFNARKRIISLRTQPERSRVHLDATRARPRPPRAPCTMLGAPGAVPDAPAGGRAPSIFGAPR